MDSPYPARRAWTDPVILRVCTQQSNEITSVVFPDSLTTIGDSAFRHNKLSGSVVFPDSVTSIGDVSFERDMYYLEKEGNDGGITSVVFGNSVTTIGMQAFRASPSILSILARRSHC